jgi:hypothetical protein
MIENYVDKQMRITCTLLFILLTPFVGWSQRGSIVSLDTLFLQNKLIIQKLNMLERAVSNESQVGDNCDLELKKLSAENSILEIDLKNLQNENKKLELELSKSNDQNSVWIASIVQSEERLTKGLRYALNSNRSVIESKLLNLIKISSILDELDSLYTVEPSNVNMSKVDNKSKEIESLIASFGANSSISVESMKYIKLGKEYCLRVNQFKEFVKGISDAWVSEVVADYFLELKVDCRNYPFLLQAQIGGLGIGTSDDYNCYLWMKNNIIECR